jgi:hypothetical protein
VKTSWLSQLWFAAALPIILAGCGKPGPSSPGRPALPEKPRTLVVPPHAAYTGAYMNFGDTEDDVTLEAIEDFEEQAGKHQAIIAFSSFWGEQRFPADALQVIRTHGSAPLIFWSPWDRPYEEELVEAHGPDKYSLTNILAGKCDAYIDRWADGARDFRDPIFVSLCNEMNGDWFPWSAKYYGGGTPIAGTDPIRYVGPEFFKRTYRYIIDRVRARGARNVLWIFHVNNFSEPYEPWNTFAQFYPGREYVDWLGMSVYGQLFPEETKWNLFEEMMHKPYDELCRLDPDKPVMVTEWGAGEFPAMGDKGVWIADAFARMEHQYTRVRAAVYWHERWQNSRTYNYLYSNLKIDSSPGALAAYRQNVALPFWLGYPVYR